MMFLQIAFCVCVALVGYTYMGYPLAIALAAKIRSPAGLARGAPRAQPVSVVVAAFNEEAYIGRRVGELARLLAGRQGGGELIMVSDGSTDLTAEKARSVAAEVQPEIGAAMSIRLIDLPLNQGKAIALNAGVAEARFPLIVFADARQVWAPDAIDCLVENFADPAVGAVSGDLVVESAPGVMAGVGLYWRFEKWLRRTESQFHSMVSVTGSISAVRRELYRPIPAGTLLDDVYWPLTIAMDGYRVVHEEQAKAFDRLPEKARDEFRRKVRTLAGNFQLIALLPAALLPWRNRVWWQFVSHRVLRLAVPWALLAVLTTSALLGGTLFGLALGGQTAFYLVGLAGLFRPVAMRSRLASAAASVLVLNAAAWVGFWVWSLGLTSRSWSKVQYQKRAMGDQPLDAIASVRAGGP
jgi:cellulose synthase/poly-beta-1,6-N-acetylglucosamine synthase-like glycosyltransferase